MISGRVFQGSHIHTDRLQVFFRLQAENLSSLFAEITNCGHGCMEWGYRASWPSLGRRCPRQRSCKHVRERMSSRGQHLCTFASELAEKLTTHINFDFIAQSGFNLWQCFSLL